MFQSFIPNSTLFISLNYECSWIDIMSRDIMNFLNPILGIYKYFSNKPPPMLKIFHNKLIWSNFNRFANLGKFRC